jgi:DHA1 family multidrug resistance protein-like MFS transporter
MARLRGLPEWQRILWIMFAAQLFSAVGFAVIFPFLPLYVADLGTNTRLSIEFWAGMVFSAQAFTMMLTAPIWGAVADRYGRKLMVQRALFGGTVILGLMAFARSAEELVLLRAIQGGITGTISAANALVAASVPRGKIGYAMGILQVGLWGGVALGPVIGGVLADQYGYQLPFLITAGLLFFAGVLVQFGVKEQFVPPARTAEKRPGFVAEWRHVLGRPGVPATFVLSFMGALIRTMILPVAPLFVAALLLNASNVNSIAGLVTGVASATATASAIYLGRLGDRLGHRRILIWSGMGALICYLPQPFVTEAWQLIALQGLTGLASGGIVSAIPALLATYTDPGEEGAVYGLDSSVASGGRTLAPLIGAGVATWLGLRAAFGAAAIGCLVLVVVAVLMLPKEKLVTVTADAPELPPMPIPPASLQPEPQPGMD